ncbi:MAG: M1 family metallopeptidase [Saprospiraceae bacterium]|nr:M1 family metallopeptidase [Saprospiraceae bacterium]
MLKYIPIFLLFCINVNTVFAQERPYFQQRVDAKIKVRLDDKQHFLRGNIRLDYTNNSPDTLTFIYIHLWPNAYANKQTAFAEQQLENGNLEFYFGKVSDRGFIDSLDFKTDGTKLIWAHDEEYFDIAKVELAAPLLPKQTVEITTPFRVKIPKTVSRLGHVGQSYQITQWYPKPAVYDREGWHPMPYLDQGEFYSEFGDVELRLELPQNYIVGASGVLLTESEKKFLAEQADSSKGRDFNVVYDEGDLSFPKSDSVFKTIEYKAENVHDFAWFADKRFHVIWDKVELASGRKVDTYVMFTAAEADYWQEAIKYVNRSVRYYSDIVGEYPYPQMTAVESALSAGGGMEYPMVTVIGSSASPASLDEVITHEVGHNWFYGILASNEREHAWMDEGFNSYVEARYMEQYYGLEPRLQYLAYLFQARKGEEQAIETPSIENVEVNYYVCAYSKPTLSFRYLERYLGTAEMDRILKIYYNTWKFQHPRPKDVRALFERESKKPVAWFFDQLINSTTQMNYGITGCQCPVHTANADPAKIRIKNKGDFSSPFVVAAVDYKDSVITEVWVENLEVGQDTLIRVPNTSETDAYRIDPYEDMPEINRNDNVAWGNGVLNRGERFKFSLIADFRKPERRGMGIIPLLGFNCYDGFMLGLTGYNVPLPARNWHYSVMPLFATRSLSLVGAGQIKHSWYHDFGEKYFKSITTGLGIRSYHSFYNESFDYRTRFVRIRPFLEVVLPQKTAKDPLQHTFQVEHLILLEESPVFVISQNPDTTYVSAKTWNARSTHRLNYIHENKTNPIAPFNLNIGLEYANYQDFGGWQHFLKMTAEANFKFKYSERWGIDFRIFAGGFPIHTDREFGDMPLQLISRNLNDYQYDNYFMGRREQSNFLSQQLSMREGAFKTPIAQSTVDGNSNTFIAAMNFKVDIPIKLPFRIPFVKLKPYLDVGYFRNSAPSVQISNPSEEIFVSGGLMLDIFDGAAGFYVPLINTEQLNNALKSNGNFWTRMSFSFNIRILNPITIAEKFEI